MARGRSIDAGSALQHRCAGEGGANFWARRRRRPVERVLDLVGELLEVGASRWTGRADRNGGFLPFFGRASGFVGSLMLEGMSERRGNPPFLSRAHLPVRLAHAALGWSASSGGLDLVGAPGAAEAPPAPPSRRRPAPSMIARQRSGISSALQDAGAGRGRAGNRETLGRATGSGWRAANRPRHHRVGVKARPCPAMCGKGCVEARNLCGGGAHVN